MFHLVGDALLSFYSAVVDDLGSSEMSVWFGRAADDREDGAGLELELWSITQPARGASSGTEVVERDGAKVRRSKLPVIELGCAVTAFGDDARTEQQLLAAALQATLRTPVVPVDHLPDELEPDTPISLHIRKSSDPTTMPVLADARRPALDVRVTFPFDLDQFTVLADAPGTADFGFADRNTGARSGRRRVGGIVVDPGAVGVDVLGPRGSATVGADGRFSIAAMPGDRIVLMVDPPVTAVIPESGMVSIP